MGISLEQQVGDSRVILGGDAKLEPRDLITKIAAKPKGSKLRPIARLCGCLSAKKGDECTTPAQHDDRETEKEYRTRIAKGRDIEVLVICTPLEHFDFYGAAGKMWPRGQTRTKVHADELEELRQEHGRIEVVTMSEIHSRVQVPAGFDPIQWMEQEIMKLKTEAAKASAPKTPEAEITPEVAALPAGPTAPTAPAKLKK